MGGAGRSWERGAARTGLWVLVLVLLPLIGAWLVWAQVRPGPTKVLLVVPPPPPSAGLNHYEARALGLLVQDVLEASPGVALTLASDLPARPEALKAGEDWLMVTLHPSRIEGRLNLRMSFRRSGALRRGTSPTVIELAEANPGHTLAEGLKRLPLRVERAALESLVPQTSEGFWDLCEGNGLRLQNRDLASAEQRSRALVRREPRCASGWFLLGSLVYRTLLDQPANDRTIQLAEVDACFQEGLALVPHYPRGRFLLAQLRTNAGNHREALGLLLEGLRTHPRSPLLHTGIVYAARNAGLLELARRAADRRDTWAFTEHQPQAIDLLFLYLGDWPRFEHSLQEQSGHLRTTPQRFYRGFLALVKGDRQSAIQAFESAEAVERGYPHYIHLARGYRLALQGQLEVSREAFKALESERVGLKVPDGEFTLRIAEGLALAGDVEAAIDLCGRAFGQGAGATLWYERSPLLAPLRGTPRWTALVQHLKDRQALLEGRYPPNCLPQD